MNLDTLTMSTDVKCVRDGVVWSFAHFCLLFWPSVIYAMAYMRIEHQIVVRSFSAFQRSILVFAWSNVFMFLCL